MSSVVVKNAWRRVFFRPSSVRDLKFLRPASDVPKSNYDAVVIGGGHNGLIAAAYLQKTGLKVGVFERRHILGGAAITEELVPGFKFSRASYVLSLLRPQIYEDLKLKEFGLKVHIRDPNSYTPILPERMPTSKARSLLLGRNGEENKRQIAQFSRKDAEAFEKYEDWLQKVVDSVEHLLDSQPLVVRKLRGTLQERKEVLQSAKDLLKAGYRLGRQLPEFLELMTAPISKILCRWFESEPLLATLATDGVIGFMSSPHSPGSGYVLLHHVIGQAEGIKGAWGYVEGGMGSLSASIGKSAQQLGVDIFTDRPVKSIVTNNNKTSGIVLEDGTEVKAKMVLSNATPHVTYSKLTDKNDLPASFTNAIRSISYKSPVCKINVALKESPNFQADPNHKPNMVMPHHSCTIHLNSEDMSILHRGYLDGEAGVPSETPLVEMVLPTSLDKTLAPPGCHVAALFTQYVPFKIKGKAWTNQDRDNYADKVFDCIEQYAPGFKKSVIGRDVLAPPDLESIIGLTGGNIFHGSLTLDQLYFMRPVPEWSDYRSPIKGLYLCGSGAHPGGGVMGAPGRNAAGAALNDFKRL